MTQQKPYHTVQDIHYKFPILFSEHQVERQYMPTTFSYGDECVGPLLVLLVGVLGLAALAGVVALVAMGGVAMVKQRISEWGDRLARL